MKEVVDRLSQENRELKEKVRINLFALNIKTLILLGYVHYLISLYLD